MSYNVMVRQHSKPDNIVVNDWHVHNDGQKDNEPFATRAEAQAAQERIQNWYDSILINTYCVTKIEAVADEVDYKALYQDLTNKVGDQIRWIRALGETNKARVEYHVNAGEYARAAECLTRQKTLESVVTKLQAGCV